MLHVHGIDLLVEKTLGSVAEEQHVEFLRPYDVMLDLIGSTAWEMNNRSTSESCVMADIPLIEGGSTGLLGQSYPAEGEDE